MEIGLKSGHSREQHELQTNFHRQRAIGPIALNAVSHSPVTSANPISDTKEPIGAEVKTFVNSSTFLLLCKV